MHLSNVSPKQCIFKIFLPQKYAFHNRHFKMKCMIMQMISDEMHSDTIAIRQKKKKKKKKINLKSGKLKLLLSVYSVL